MVLENLKIVQKLVNVVIEYPLVVLNIVLVFAGHFRCWFLNSVFYCRNRVVISDFWHVASKISLQGHVLAL